MLTSSFLGNVFINWQLPSLSIPFWTWEGWKHPPTHLPPSPYLDKVSLQIYHKTPDTRCLTCNSLLPSHTGPQALVLPYVCPGPVLVSCVPSTVSHVLPGPVLVPCVSWASRESSSVLLPASQVSLCVCTQCHKNVTQLRIISLFAESCRTLDAQQILNLNSWISSTRRSQVFCRSKLHLLLTHLFEEKKDRVWPWRNSSALLPIDGLESKPWTHVVPSDW